MSFVKLHFSLAADLDLFVIFLFLDGVIIAAITSVAIPNHFYFKLALATTATCERIAANVFALQIHMQRIITPVKFFGQGVLHVPLVPLNDDRHFDDR